MSTARRSRTTAQLWLLIAVGILAVTVAAGAAFATREGRVVWLGSLALALFLASALYIPRKRLFLSRLGPLHPWMLSHITMGSVLLVAVVLHAGVTDVGTQGWILYGLTVAEVGSGLWGFYELRATPRRFAALSKGDFIFPSAVKKRIAVLRGDIERTCDKREELGAWFHEHYAAALDGTGELPACEGYPKGSKRHATALHDEAAEVVRLEKLRVDIDRVDRISRRWLWVHVPVSVAFIVFVAVHVAGWWYFG